MVVHEPCTLLCAKPEPVASKSIMSSGKENTGKEPDTKAENLVTEPQRRIELDGWRGNFWVHRVFNQTIGPKGLEPFHKEL